MLPLVCVPAARLREGLPADPALVGLLPGMRQLVFLQTGHLGEALRAAVELADIGALPGVSSYVVLEVSGGGESLSAVCVRAHERSLPRVDPSVDVQVLGRVEAFIAPGELALTGSVRDVDLLDVRSEVGGEGEGPSAAGMVALVGSLSLLFRYSRNAGVGGRGHRHGVHGVHGGGHVVPGHVAF